MPHINWLHYFDIINHFLIRMISYGYSPLKNQEPIDSTQLYSTIDVRWYKLEPSIAHMIKHKFVIIITERASNYVWSYLEDVCLRPNVCKFIEAIFEQFHFLPKYFTTQEAESNAFLKEYFLGKYNIKKLSVPTNLNYREENKKVIIQRLNEKVLRQEFHYRTVKLEYQKMIAQYNCSIHKSARNIPRLAFKERKMGYWTKQQIEKDVIVKKKSQEEQKVEKDILEILMVTEENLKLLGSIQIPKKKQENMQLSRIQRALSWESKKAIQKLRNKPFLSSTTIKDKSIYDKREILHQKIRHQARVKANGARKY